MSQGDQRWYLKQWRKHRGYTLERLAEMIGTSVGYLSDLEKGKRRYNQDHLEALATALQCEPADLLRRGPNDPETIQTHSMMSVWGTLDPVQRAQLVQIAKTLKQTGTDG